MRDLQASLRNHSMAMLRVIAELNGVDLTTNVREDASSQLAEALLAPEALPDALHRCSDAARAAWHALVTAGGSLKVPVFTRRFGTVRPAGPAKLERDTPWRAPSNATEELWYRGLIYRAFADLERGPVELFYIPGDLLAAAPAVQQSPEIATLPELFPLATAQAPGQARRALPLPVDACTLLAFLTEAPVRADGNGALRPSDEARLREALLLPDPVRFTMLFTLACDLGWLAQSGAVPGRLSVQSDSVGAWLHESPWEQRSALFAAWRDSTEWNDLRRMPSVRAEGEWRNDPRLARRAVLAALARLQPGQWYAIADLITLIKETNPDFQRPDANYGGWYLRDAATGRYLSGFESWDEVEGRLIYFLITEPLFWLAAVELGMVDEGHREAFRLSTLGAAWICGQAPPEMPAPAKLAVDDEFTVTAPLQLPLVDRYRLLRFTEPVPELPQPGQPTRHRITRRSLAQARTGGLHAQRILQFLRHASGGRVPERVETALERWEQHGGAVRVTRGAVLRVEDANILSALRSDPALAPLLGELLSAQAVLVPGANLPRVLAALAQLGYSTQMDE